ncbi:MAG TPA: electron transfer flavoprotein subunit alpha/FixB family protein [Candidatus Limnocylindrales bacterium]|nr:electron transfer flavoprotein subunit alpha/FixB family protein [Candidatus Limnocylindrales bacterium]
MTAPILALVTITDGVPERASLEALSLARRLAAETGAVLEAVLLADIAAARPAATTLAGSGVTTVIVIEHPNLTADHPDGWAAAVAQIVEARRPAAVVGAGTERGNELLARVAARMSLPMAANCLSVEPGERYRSTRQRWAGSLLEDCWLDADIRLITVAPNSVAIGEPDASLAPAIEAVAVTLSDRDLAVHVTSREAPERGRLSLADAKVVVGGGRGVGSGEGFADLEELAGLLGGAVGGSRVVTSAGWRPHADQIGQTGLRIAPDVYIACGISGAIQHVVGCKAAKHILAINTDPDSPIMSVADYAVIGDLHTILPAISAEIRRRSAARA